MQNLVQMSFILILLNFDQDKYKLLIMSMKTYLLDSHG